MTVTISRLYNSYPDAQAAINRLEAAGVKHGDISVLASNADEWYKDGKQGDVYLTVLRAVRWIGPTTPAHAFEKPQLTITFTTSPDDKNTHKLLVGGPAGDGEITRVSSRKRHRCS